VIPEPELPVFQLLLAILVFTVSVVGMAWSPAASTVEKAISRTAAWLRRTGVMTTVDLPSALLRIDLLRIVLGLLLLTRFWPDLAASRHAAPAIVQIAAASGVALSAALTIGLATPLVALLLAFSLNLVLDPLGTNYSLGSFVVANCLIPIVVAPAGYTVSVDRILLKSPTPVGGVLRALYGMWGTPTIDRVVVGRCLALLAYATLSAYSAIQHLDSPTWRSGAVTSVILLSPVSSPAWAPLAQSLYTRAHVPWVVFSLISTYGMLVWQLGLVPLVVASRWTRRCAVVWGLLFFALSMYVMQLNRLGVYEFVLWGLVFWDGRPILWRRPTFKPVGGRDRLATAFMLGVVVFWGLFLGEWALFERPEKSEEVRRRAPLVAGIGFVNVFTEINFLIYRHRVTANSLSPSGHQKPLEFVPNEALDRALTTRLYESARKPTFCDPQFARMWFEGFARASAFRSAGEPARVSMEFTSWTHPTNRELAQFAFVPIHWRTDCVVQGNMRALEGEWTANATSE